MATIPVITPEGQDGFIPPEKAQDALTRGFYFPKHTFVTTPDGDTGLVPHENVSAALKRGFKLGPASQQGTMQTGEQLGSSVAPIKPGVKSGISMNAPVASLVTGVAGGAGIPETQHPVRDLAAGIIDPPNVLTAGGGQAPVVPEIQPGDLEAEQKALANRTFLQRLAGVRGDLDPAIAARIDARNKARAVNAYENYVPGIPLVSPAIAASANQADKSAAAFKGGRPYEGTVRAVGAAVPIIGPAAVESGNEIGEGIQNKDVDQALHGAGSGIGLVAGLSTGTKRGQAVTEKVISKTVRPVINATTSAPVVATSKVLGGGPEAMQKAPIKQQTAAGAATNAEVRNYAASKGIDLLPGQATQARGLQTLQAVGERSIVAPGELPDVLEKQKAAFGNAVDDFKQRVGTEAIPDTEASGLSLQSQAHNGLDTLKKAAQADYQGFEAKAGDIPVDLSDVKAKAQAAMAGQAEALRNVPAKYANPIRNVLGKLSNLEAGPAVNPKTMAEFQGAVEQYGLGPEQQAALREKMGIPPENAQTGFTMSTAQQLRSAYLDISRDFSGNVPKSVQRYAGQAAKDIDTAMAKAADQVGATDQWRQANAKWKQLQQTYNNPEHPLYKILDEPDSVKVPSKLLGKGSYGGSPNTVRQLRQAGIDLSPLKREVAQQIADKNFSLTNGGRGLAGYTTPFLQELFSPEEFNELTTMGRVGRAIKFEMNPSGTSNVMEGHRQIHGIIHRTAGAVVGPIASRITTSKALARAAMGDVGPVAAQPRGLLDILGSRGPEPPPETPPTSGAPGTPNQGPGAPPAPKASGAAAPAEERGIKPPQKRTFERQTEADVKQFFSYRFDQLRNELKTAQAAGDQNAIADVQRRMGELDQIQRQPRALQDVLAGKPPKTAAEYEAQMARPKSKVAKKGGK